jgi:hypothetical protein
VCSLDSGSVTWAWGLGGSSADYGGGVEVYNGSVYVTGTFSTTVYTHVTNLTSAGGSDVFAARLSGISELLVQSLHCCHFQVLVSFNG